MQLTACNVGIVHPPPLCLGDCIIWLGYSIPENIQSWKLRKLNDQLCELTAAPSKTRTHCPGHSFHACVWRAEQRPYKRTMPQVVYISGHNMPYQLTGGGHGNTDHRKQTETISPGTKTQGAPSMGSMGTPECPQVAQPGLDSLGPPLLRQLSAEANYGFVHASMQAARSRRMLVIALVRPTLLQAAKVHPKVPKLGSPRGA